tara:strand:+ start:3614 stop:4039 length:426 start_codon:yes stop_codon:yes gene_type:complete
MAKKQTSFADKAARLGKASEATYAKYIKSVRSEKTGKWRFNEQMIRMNKGETLEATLKRMDEVANLVDIDLTQFEMETVAEESENVEKEVTSDPAETDLEKKSLESDLDTKETGENREKETAETVAEASTDSEEIEAGEEE